MSRAERPLLAWIALALLGALVATNVAFLILLRTGGPLIGAVLYVALLVLTWRRRNYRDAVMGGLVGLAVHVVEVVTIGWTDYPLLMALNLALPAALALVAWLAGREV